MVLHSKACGRVTRSELDVKRPEARTSQVIKGLELAWQDTEWRGKTRRQGGQ